MLEDVTGELCLLEVLTVLEVREVMRCALLCILEAPEGGLRLLEAFKVLEVLEVMEGVRRVVLCMLEVLEVMEVMEAMEAMRRVLLCMLEVLEAFEVMEATRRVLLLEVTRCVILEFRGCDISIGSFLVTVRHRQH